MNPRIAICTRADAGDVRCAAMRGAATRRAAPAAMVNCTGKLPPIAETIDSSNSIRPVLASVKGLEFTTFASGA
jgi:hypothetical protein